jgi:hypothetical protein
VARYGDLRVCFDSKLDKFRSLYALDPKAVHGLFLDIQSDIVGDKKLIKTDIKYLVSTIYWLKCYDTEEGVNRVFEIGSRDTFRRYTRKCLDALQALCQAKACILMKDDNFFILTHSIAATFNFRLFGHIQERTIADRRYDALPTFLASVDGVHCSIKEPRKDPSSKWYSHKTNVPALNYQVVLSLRENKVQSISGPYPAGESDIKVFRKPDGIMSLISAGKCIIANCGYNGETEKLSAPSDHDAFMTCNLKKHVRARRETFNARLN